MGARMPVPGVRFAALWLGLWASLLLASCAAPQYDEKADAQITGLQKEVDSQIVQFIADAHAGDAESLKKSSYANNVDWYNKVDSDLSSLELRMEAVVDPSTKNLPQIFGNFRTQMSNLQTVHKKKKNLGWVDWTATRNQLNVTFAVLLTYELSLKAAGTSSSGTTKSTATDTANAKAASLPAP
jgi:hypothetical protein